MDRRLLRLGLIDTGYTTVGWALATMGVGMGFTMAPATESIMGSLPVAKAGVGSAMNDTTRQVGGALGVAVIGSIMSSAYSTAIEPVLGRLPAQAAAAAGDSVGAALQIAQNAGPQGELLAQAAREAFVSGLGGAMWVAVGVALVGQSIIAAAQDLLAEVGYDALTIEGVADRAGVGKTTVYRRWSDKEQVVLAAIEDFYQDLPFLGWSPDDQSRTWQPGRPWARPTRTP